jgi:hypothetical protein
MLALGINDINLRGYNPFEAQDMPALHSGVQVDIRKLGRGGGMGKPNSRILIRGIFLITWYMEKRRFEQANN